MTKLLFHGRDVFFFLILLHAAGSPRVPHPFLLLRDVLLRGWVAHPLSEPAAAGLSCLEVSRSSSVVWSATEGGASLIRTSVAGTWADPWWAVLDSMTPRPSWTPTSLPSVRKKAGANWPSTSCPSSTISMGTKPLSVSFIGAFKVELNHETCDGTFLFFSNRMIYVLVSS